MNNIFDHARIPLAGRSVIEASAGTGKTYAIMQIFLRLLLEKRIPLEAILVVTFTEAATAELRSRIRGALVQCSRAAKGEQTSFLTDNPDFAGILDRTRPDAFEIRAIIESALASFDESSIFTIHGFCNRVLRDHAFEYSSIFNSELLDDMSSLKREVTLDFYRNRFYRASSFALEWRLREKITVDSLLSLLGTTLPRADVRIIPDADIHVSLEQCEKDLTVLFGAMNGKWKKDVSSLRELMMQSLDSLSKVSYKPDKIPLWFESLSAYFDAPYQLEENHCINYFTTEKMQSAVKKGCDASGLLSHPLVHSCDEFVALYREIAERLAVSSASFRAEYLRYAIKTLGMKKRERNLWSFDDLISQVRNGLSSDRGDVIASSLRRRYQAALIDEFQDTDPAQCAIFETIFGQEPNLLFYIGDPKQAIYSFRGADVYAYIDAKKDKTIYQKDENWRSNGELVDAINNLFACADPFMLGDDVSYYPVRAAAGMRLTVEGDTDESAILWAVPPGEKKAYSDSVVRNLLEKAVTGEVSRLIEKGSSGKAVVRNSRGEGKELHPGDIAIIVRRNSDAYEMKETLRRAGIASVIAQSGSVFESPIRWQFDLMLSALITRKEHHIRAALMTDLFGLSASEIDVLSHNEIEWEDALESFRRYSVIWESRGFMPMITGMFERHQIQKTLVTRNDGTRKLVDLL
ncbi:MAG TPA: UvrD-helicase domain-containing protein, partial [Spirochaetota bacterium]